jgi:superfamily II DNA helicase RecQ
MPTRFFTIAALDPRDGEEELNQFLSSYRIASVERHLVAVSGGAQWCIAVDWLQADRTASASTGAGTTGKRGRLDYKQLLEPEDFSVFSALREVRKQIGETESIPLYAIMTNEQLAEMARRRPTTPQALGQIDGVGEAKVEKYGTRLLAAVRPRSSRNSSNGATGTAGANGSTPNASTGPVADTRLSPGLAAGGDVGAE